jgi:hypothetical protein
MSLLALLIGDQNYNSTDKKDKFSGKLLEKIKSLFSKFGDSSKKSKVKQ